MARVAVSRHLPIPPEQVWDALADLGSHVEWMRDARSIEFTTTRTRGLGTRMEVLTVVGPLRTTDIVEVVGWDEGQSIEIRHEGLIKGRGIIGVVPDGDGSLVTWVERLTFPWWLGGPVTAWLTRPILAAIWRANLERLEGWLSCP